LDDVVHDVAEEPIEDLEGCVDFLFFACLDELVYKAEQLSPDSIVLVLLHRSLNFDSERTNLMRQVLSACGYANKDID
jgi:hypothetical protein